MQFQRSYQLGLISAQISVSYTWKNPQPTARSNAEAQRKCESILNNLTWLEITCNSLTNILLKEEFETRHVNANSAERAGQKYQRMPSDLTWFEPACDSLTNICISKDRRRETRRERLKAMKMLMNTEVMARFRRASDAVIFANRSNRHRDLFAVSHRNNLRQRGTNNRLLRR